MELLFSKRKCEPKLEAKRLRRSGQIPAILYSQGKEGEAISIDSGSFKKILMRLEAGSLPTTVFSLKGDGGKATKAIIKEIQYQITTYEPIHLDFEALVPGVAVTVRVPVRLIGVADCIGVKMGGILKQVARYIPVSCKPEKGIPSFFEIDVRDLNLGQSKRFSDISMPDHVRPLIDLKLPVAVITK